MGKAATNHDEDHEGDIPLATLPGGCDIPDDDANHGGDVTAVFGTGAEEDDEHEDGGEDGLAERLMLIL